MSASAAAIATEAHDRWLCTLRWKSLNGAIGQRRILGAASGWADYLMDSTTEKRFYSGGHFFTVGPERLITKRMWTAVANSLLAGEASPVWLDFLFEGEHRLMSDDLHGGIVCLAIACESIVRTLMTKHLKRPVNEAFASATNQVPIRRILDQWKNLGFWNPQWRQVTDIKKLQRLFELRNAVMHRGQDEFDKTECLDIAKWARSFILHASPYAEVLYG